MNIYLYHYIHINISFGIIKMTASFLTKYRPSTIKDFKLNDYMEKALYSFIQMEELNILLYGNTSSGKTMLLDAIIREYYNLSESSQIPENNILLINNLKEQGIQYYRNEMKSFCQKTARSQVTSLGREIMLGVLLRP